MAYKRILVMQDISCVGQCSMTVALPVLSACGHEVCILPTEVLSTHTGGFGKPFVFHLDAYFDGILNHWKENGLLFDAVLVGYLGSITAVDAAERVLNQMMAPDGVFVVDPAFADNGKRYSGLSEEYARKMERLCRKADIILPNITEAAYFSGMEYRDIPDGRYVDALLDNLNHSCVILTGVGFTEEQTGVLVYENGKKTHITHERISRSFHGTGDLFAACFMGALLQEKTRTQAARIAASFVLKSIENTVAEPAHWYGVKFETALADLVEWIK